MKRIFERIVVGDASPTSDALWIDTKQDPPVFKMSFDGTNWIELAAGSGDSGSGGGSDELRIDFNNPDVNNGGDRSWALSLDTSSFENKESVSLIVDNFEVSPVLLEKVGPDDPNLFVAMVRANSIKYTFRLCLNEELPDGDNSIVLLRIVAPGQNI